MATEASEERRQTEADNLDNEEASNDPELLIKHPLQNKWALWFYKNDRTKDWKDNLRCITAFDTVEDFWSLYNYLRPCSGLPAMCDYCIFKDGVEPMWEDDMNKHGGRWLINLEKRQRMTELDNFWLETLLCLIGEAFGEYSDEICGAVVNIRPKVDKLSLWTHDANKRDATLKIGTKLKERLNIPRNIVIGFQSHKDSMVKSSSSTKNKYTI